MRRMMPKSNIQCLLITTVVLGHSFSIYANADETLDVSAALDAFTVSRSWIDLFDDEGLPPPTSPQSAIPIPGATGVAVILRRAGHVIALATDAQPDQWMVRRAVGRALSQVLGSAGAANLPRDMRDELATQVSLEIEVAGHMQPILATTAAQLNNRLAAGSDGLALRHEERWYLEFPSAARAFNRRIAAPTLAGLLGEAGLPPRPLSELARQPEMGVYRFTTLDLAQRSPQALPLILEQGDTLVEASSITPARITQAANEIASHLLTKAWPGPEPVGLLGGYNPVTDSYIPLIASDEDQLIIAMALRRYARIDRANPTQAEQARELSASILTALATRRNNENAPPLHPVLAGFIVLAWADEMPYETNSAALHQEARDTILALTMNRSALKLNPHEQAIIVSAMTAISRQAGQTDLPPLTPEMMTEWIDATWTLVPENEYVSLHPWLGWAVIDMNVISGETTSWDQMLRRQRRLLQTAQDGPEDAPWAPTLDGGFPLGLGTKANATAQGLRPGILLATMLGQQHLTNDQELAAAIESQLSAMRFLIQLMHRIETPHQPRTPKRAVGGVRAALWDQNQPSAAQAMGLIMACETLESLRILTKRHVEPK